MDSGVDLCIVKHFREGTVGATWPRIHLHGSFPLTECLNPAAEKGPQKVHAR
jgi:hypothetical protein